MQLTLASLTFSSIAVARLLQLFLFNTSRYFLCLFVNIFVSFGFLSTSPISGSQSKSASAVFSASVAALDSAALTDLLMR